MKYVKIVYRKDYDTIEEKSNRCLIRAYEKAGINHFFENGNPVVYGYFYNSCLFELLTNRPISSRNYEDVDFRSVFDTIRSCSKDELNKLANIINVVFFDENIDLGYEITTMEEAAYDRSIQLKAYEKGLTSINPYDIFEADNYSVKKIKMYNRR